MVNDDESDLANPGLALFGMVWIPDRGLRKHYFDCASIRIIFLCILGKKEGKK